ncbi:MAG: ABC transporter ATP-binding protein [Planctomycetes bacterium]|nr:ABC transporter ATP-binding protein [Planctomycetota bacterium]
MTRAAPFRRLLDHASSHRGALWRASAWSFTNKVLDLAPPLLIGLAVDAVVQRDASWLASFGLKDPFTQVVVIGIATIVIFILESWTEYRAAVEFRELAQAVQHDLRLDAYRHVQTLELGYFEKRSSGELMSVLNDDINQLERFLDVGFAEVVQVVTTVVFVSIWFVILSPTLAFVSMIPMPFLVWGSVVFQRHMAPRYTDVRQRVGELNARLANDLQGMATIQAYGAEDHEAAQLAVESGAYKESNRRAIKLSAAFTPLIRMLVLIGFAASMIYGGYLTLEGALAAGAYSSVLVLTQRLLWPLTRLGATFDLYQRAMASTTRVLDLLTRKPTIVSGSHSAPVRGEIRFDDVGFAYVEGFPVLDGVTIDVPAGSSVAVVGSTGSGKTTLVKLLLRFYDVLQGAVTVDGASVRDWNLECLRDSIGVVSQDVYLFHGTVRENIAYGRRDATEAELRDAARLSEAEAFIEALPQGWDTIVGERGQRLSGGQRQRISLARAILKDPKILVLDEATSAVDNETEAAIQRSLAQVSVGRTTLVIAHRLSTIRHADHIYVLENGRVVEDGKHETLLARSGVYDRLWRVQTGEAVSRATR